MNSQSNHHTEKSLSAAGAELMFSPLRLNGIELANRIVMAPMTRYRSSMGIPDPEVATYYGKRAAGGTGLLITEGTWIPHPAASNRANIPCFYGEAALRRWAGVAEAVHAGGGRIFPQLWHVGMVRILSDDAHHPGATPVGPSGLTFEAGAAEPVQRGAPMTQAEIDSVVGAFGDAAASARELGFDGIEIHGAHGYLIDQFLWHVTNRREDGYGGADIGQRTRFATEVIKECRRRAGPTFPISFRFSQWKINDYSAAIVQTAGELERMLVPLVDAGVDVFHCSTRRYWEPGFSGNDMTLAGWTRKISGKPTIAVGSVGLNQAFEVPTLEKDDMITVAASLDRIQKMLADGECDLVAVGRALIANPDWANKVQTGGLSSMSPFSKELLKTLL